MWKSHVEAFRLSFTDIFNMKNDDAKGRTIYLFCTLLAAFYNVFITGIFYTGFLTMYGISITGAGIVTFIPYIANTFSIFSSKILTRFKRRKPVLIAAKIYFYAMYIIATTVMPQFVHDNDARLTWFVIILFLAYAVYAPFGPGFTMWFYKFYPNEPARRTRYISLLQIFSSIMSTAILLLSGVITDALSGSPYQDTIILVMRYFAFVLVIIEIIVQARAKEYPAEESSNPKLSQVFTIPFKYKKFLACMVLMFCWNFIANLNNGLWSYYLLNRMHFSYSLINSMSATYTVILLLLSPFWRRILRRYSWIKTFGLATLIWVPTEIVFFFMTPERAWIYVPMCICQHLLSVGLNLSYANILYMNLPSENSTTCIAFNTIGCNIFAFLGLMTGTFVSSLTDSGPILFLGMETYGVQYTTLMRAVTMLTMGLVLILRWRSFTGEEEIADIEQGAKVRKELRKNKMLRQTRFRLPSLKDFRKSRY
ncbi:MAG: MFS transporter [Firmicutes bacterium]|nr:MFS transporter [Bacillota bacterium]